MGGSPSKTREIATSLLNETLAEALLTVQQDCNTNVAARQRVTLTCLPNDGYNELDPRLRRPNESNLACFRAMQNVFEGIKFSLENARTRGDDLRGTVDTVDETGETVQRPYAEVFNERIQRDYANTIGTCKSCTMTDIDMSLVNNFQRECVVDAEFVSKVQSEMAARIEQMAKNDDDFLAGFIDAIPSFKQERESIQNAARNLVTNTIDQKILQDMQVRVEQIQEVNVSGATQTVRGISQNQAVGVLVEAATQTGVFQDTINSLDFMSIQEAVRRRDTTGELADAGAAIAKAASDLVRNPVTIIFIVAGVLGVVAIIVFIVLIARKKKKLKADGYEKAPPPPRGYEPLPPPPGVVVPDGQALVVPESQVGVGPTGALVDMRTGYPVRRQPRKLTPKQIMAIIVAVISLIVVGIIVGSVISTSQNSGSLNSSNSSKNGTAGSSESFTGSSDGSGSGS